MRSLLEQVHAHLVANKLPIAPDWQAQVENFTCQGLGADFCYETDPRWGWLTGQALKFRAVLAGTEILGKWALSGMPFVPQEQADARSVTCAGCVYNQNPQDCQTCAWPALTKLVSKILGDRRSKRHADLKSCASCGCNLQVKVHFPLEFLKASFGYSGELPSHCWVRKEQEGTNG